MNNLVQSQAISIFNFKSTPVRTQLLDGNIWFCLIDVCDSLNLKRKTNWLSRLSEEGLRKMQLLSNGGVQETTFINEPNLYRLIFRSNKPAAIQFGNWVYEEVLPTIRKTGSYGAVDMKAIGGTVKRCAAVAVREEISKVFEKALVSAEKLDVLGEISDDDLIRCLYSWYATHHKKTFDAMREVMDENDQLKCKLLAVKQAIK